MSEEIGIADAIADGREAAPIEEAVVVLGSIVAGEAGRCCGHLAVGEFDWEDYCCGSYCCSCTSCSAS